MEISARFSSQVVTLPAVFLIPFGVFPLLAFWLERTDGFRKSPSSPVQPVLANGSHSSAWRVGSWGLEAGVRWLAFVLVLAGCAFPGGDMPTGWLAEPAFLATGSWDVTTGTRHALFLVALLGLAFADGRVAWRWWRRTARQAERTGPHVPLARGIRHSAGMLIGVTAAAGLTSVWALCELGQEFPTVDSDWGIQGLLSFRIVGEQTEPLWRQPLPAYSITVGWVLLHLLAVGLGHHADREPSSRRTEAGRRLVLTMTIAVISLATITACLEHPLVWCWVLAVGELYWVLLRMTRRSPTVTDKERPVGWAFGWWPLACLGPALGGTIMAVGGYFRGLPYSPMSRMSWGQLVSVGCLGGGLLVALLVLGTLIGRQGRQHPEGETTS